MSCYMKGNICVGSLSHLLKGAELIESKDRMNDKEEINDSA